MSCDKLVFDLSQEVEGSPSVFLKKDWISILDNQNGSYSSNQSVIDTSQLSNSNKYMSYREAYLSVPLLITVANAGADTTFLPAAAGTSADMCVGLKNWFGQIIHSFTLDYNGTTIVQQTPFINMWNSFKLMTTLSWNDVATIGSTIGFYPDDPLAWTMETWASAGTSTGSGVCNNTNFKTSGNAATLESVNAKFNAGAGNIGFLKRQQYISFDPDGFAGAADAGTGSAAYSTIMSADNAKTLWKSYISKKQSSVTSGSVSGLFQISVQATIYLKHIHSFFQQVPLLKGVFMKMTLNLNNSTTTITRGASTTGIATQQFTVTNSVGGVNPLMIAATLDGCGGNNIGGASGLTTTLYYDISVGATVLNSTVSALAGSNGGQLSRNIQLYCPAYTFNPSFESAYLSSPIKKIKYTDVYQYQVPTVNAGLTFNQLLTNGIAGIKSVLLIPFYAAGTGATGSGSSDLPSGVNPYQSPFDPAGCGATSPLCHLSNFNVVVSGQNMLYNTQRYLFEEFNNQLLGVNAVNGGLTDGLTSSLINSLGFEMEYCYYYVDVSRMLPVEESVPKSVQVIGQNTSQRNIQLMCFIEYGCEVDIDVLTGTRV
jgi:hypothetical protein